MRRPNFSDISCICNAANRREGAISHQINAIEVSIGATDETDGLVCMVLPHQ
jgi:hypothetical protein